MPQPVIAIVGPTAAGKSGLSLQLARLLDGEIVNADSMQLYRGMDIGTAKLPPDQREGVPHHLLDILDVTAAANVAEYQRLARRVIDAIHARGPRAVLVTSVRSKTRLLSGAPRNQVECRTRQKSSASVAFSK